MSRPMKNKSSLSVSKRRDYLRPRSPVVQGTPVHHYKSHGKFRYSPQTLHADEAEALEIRQQHQAAPIPKDVCTRQHIPSHATFGLTQIGSLLQYVAPGSIVVFDIDDTLIKKRSFGSSLLTTEGMKAFHLYIQQHMKDKTFTEKQQLVNSLHEHVKSFVLAEDNTAQVVKALQARGCYVFGLTARAHTMAHTTNQCLSSLGINLAACPPPTLPRRTTEPQTSAVINDGIVYCNDIDKGVVFQRLLQLNWVSWPNKHTCNTTCGTNCTKTSTIVSNSVHEPHHSAGKDDSSCPERTVWFVDDCLPMITGMISQWGVMAQNQAQVFSQLGPWSTQLPCRGKFALVCCNYTHPAAATTPQVPSGCIPHCIDYQIREYIASGRVLTDVEAYNALREQQQQQQQQQNNTTTVVPAAPVSSVH